MIIQLIILRWTLNVPIQRLKIIKYVIIKYIIIVINSMVTNSLESDRTLGKYNLLVMFVL